jgi:hypothetical protein
VRQSRSGVVLHGLGRVLGAAVVAVDMKNGNRTVPGPVSAECPPTWHSVPFGNWGVSSPYGGKIDGNQFQGWCHNYTACDNYGWCIYSCGADWYEWNSCTTDRAFTPPNCTLYNSSNCTQQASTRGEGAYVGFVLVERRGCPYDTNGDGICDSGGCKPVTGISVQAGYMTVYEMDAPDEDDLVQSVYYSGNFNISLSCEAGYCFPAQSSWKSPSSYDPPSPIRLTANIKAVVPWAEFADDSGTCTSSCVY